MVGLPRLPDMIQPDWMRRARDPLAIGVLASVVVHGLLLALKFKAPEPVRFAPSDARLEIVLLNAKSQLRPVKAEVLAQVDLEGGGDRDAGRARSPLPAREQVSDGTDLREQRRRIQQLEERQRRLLAMAGAEGSAPLEQSSIPQQQPDARGQNDQDVDSAIARLQAQIDKQISDYNKRPKRLTFGVNAVGVSYARYVDEWASKIERIGTERYPAAARGKLYDSLIITVEIDRYGNVVDVIFNRKSRHEVLNRAAREIVLAGAPYARFPEQMAREGDILQIVRTWTFTNDSLATQSVEKP